jgi:hypothetical protein
MTGSRRDEPKEVRSAGEADPGSPSGSGSDRTSRRLRRILLERNLVTENDIATALASETSPEADLGDLLVRMRVLDEHDLVVARAELYGMETIDLRQADPEPGALSLIPDSVAREH